MTKRHRSVINVKIDTQGCGLGEDVADLRFELGVESSAVETELVVVMYWREKNLTMIID